MLKKEAKEIRIAKIELKETQRSGGYGNQWGLVCKRQDWRHKFIAYCMIRGRSLEQIERYCHEDNKPNMVKVERLIKEFSDAD